MKTIIIFLFIVASIGILWYVADYGVSIKAVPTLQEYVASTTALRTVDKENNQASAAWLASSTIIGGLLPSNTGTSTKNISTSTKVKQSITTTERSIAVSQKIPLADKNNSPLTKIKTPKGVIYAFVAKNPTTRAQGLSGYGSLDVDKGMLFIFPSLKVQGFWMKDMNFPLDIVWIDSDRKIVGVDSNISPKTYPKTFFSPSKIQFVLEVNAGIAEKLGLMTGTRVVF